MNIKWGLRFLQLAEQVATWSKDPSTKVGAVIVDDRRRVVGLGYNGFPDCVPDNSEWYEDRETKYEMIVHAEVNAILNATRSVRGCELFITMPPCIDCTKFIMQAGIGRVHWRDPSIGMSEEALARWGDRIEASKRGLERGFIPVCVWNDYGPVDS